MYRTINARKLPKALRGTNRKHKATITTSATVSINPLWDGGSKESYAWFKWSGSDWIPVARDVAAEVSDRKRSDGRTLEAFGSVYRSAQLRPGFVCVVGGIFRGKTASLTIHGNPDDIVRIEHYTLFSAE